MKQNCVTTTMDMLADQGGRFVVVGCRRSPLMHVWHEAADGTVTRYEPDAPLRHWTHALGGYPGHTVAHAQVQARPIAAWQLVAFFLYSFKVNDDCLHCSKVTVERQTAQFVDIHHFAYSRVGFLFQ